MPQLTYFDCSIQVDDSTRINDSNSDYSSESALHYDGCELDYYFSEGTSVWSSTIHSNLKTWLPHRYKVHALGLPERSLLLY